MALDVAVLDSLVADVKGKRVERDIAKDIFDEAGVTLVEAQDDYETAEDIFLDKDEASDAAVDALIAYVEGSKSNEEPDIHTGA